MSVFRFSIPGNRVKDFANLFYSKDEWSALEYEKQGNAIGFKEKLKAKLELAKVSMFKDVSFQKKIEKRLTNIGIPETKLRGTCKLTNEIATIEITIKGFGQSLLHRIFLDDVISVLLIECKNEGNQTEIIAIHVRNKLVESILFFITVLLTCACILPGILFYSYTSSSKKLGIKVAEQIFLPAFKEQFSS